MESSHLQVSTNDAMAAVAGARRPATAHAAAGCAAACMHARALLHFTVPLHVALQACLASLIVPLCRVSYRGVRGSGGNGELLRRHGRRAGRRAPLGRAPSPLLVSCLVSCRLWLVGRARVLLMQLRARCAAPRKPPGSSPAPLGCRPASCLQLPNPPALSLSPPAFSSTDALSSQQSCDSTQSYDSSAPFARRWARFYWKRRVSTT